MDVASATLAILPAFLVHSLIVHGGKRWIYQLNAGLLKIKLDANLIFADLLQVVQTTFVHPFLA